MSTVQDSLEQRARQAGRGAVMAVAGTRVDVSSVTRRKAPGRRAAWVAAALIAVLVAGLVVLKSVGHEDRGLPSFTPHPIKGATVFRSDLQPGVRFRVPTTRLVVRNTASVVQLGFSDVGEGGLLAIQVGSYPGHDGKDLVHDLAVDNRVRILSRRSSSVGGEPATRLVVQPVPGTNTSDWFCPTGGRPCMSINATGGNTVYVVTHGGHRYVLVGGALNDAETARMRHVVDGAAASWRW